MQQNKKMKKKIAIFSAALVLSVPIVPAFAQVSDLAVRPGEGEIRTKKVQVEINEDSVEAGTQKTGARAERKELAGERVAAKRLEFEAKKEKMAADRCQNIEQRIASRVNRYENNGQMLAKVYGNMKTRLTRLSAQLKASGADTTKLDADLATLYARIDKLLADQANFMTTLKASQTAACGSTEGDFKTQLENARKVPEIIKQGRTEIKTMFQTTIKADLQAIMVQLGGTLETTAAPQTSEATEVEDNDEVEVKKEVTKKKTVTNGTSSTSSSTSSTSSSTSTTTAQ